MDPNAGFGPKQVVDLNRLGRVALLSTHEPLRFIGPDGKGRQIRWAESLVDAQEQLVMGGGVSREEKTAFR